MCEQKYVFKVQIQRRVYRTILGRLNKKVVFKVLTKKFLNIFWKDNKSDFE